MAIIDPKMQARVDSLSPALKEEIMKQEATIHTIQDLIQCLEKLTAEA